MKMIILVALLFPSILAITQDECNQNPDTDIWYYGNCISKSCIDQRVAYLKPIDEMQMDYSITEANGMYTVELSFSDPDNILDEANCLNFNIRQNSNPIPTDGSAITFSAPTPNMRITPTKNRDAQTQFTYITFTYTQADVEETCYFKDTGDKSKMTWSCRFYFTFDLQSQAQVIFAFENLIQVNTAVDGSITKAVDFGALASAKVCGSDTGCLVTRNIASSLFFCDDLNCVKQTPVPQSALVLNKFFYMIHKITTSDFLTKYITQLKVIFESPDLKITLNKGDGAFPTVIESQGQSILKLRVPVFGNNVQIFVNGIIANTADSRRILKAERILADPAVQNVASQQISAGNISPYDASTTTPTTTTPTTTTPATTPETVTNSQTTSQSTNTNVENSSTLSPVPTTPTSSDTNEIKKVVSINTSSSGSNGVILLVSMFLIVFLAILI